MIRTSAAGGKEARTEGGRDTALSKFKVGHRRAEGLEVCVSYAMYHVCIQYTVYESNVSAAVQHGFYILY